MADLRDERGSPIYLTDQNGKPAQLMDEFGNAMHLTGVATTVPQLKESSYTGPHPITAPITTTNTPHHAQPISVSHNTLEDHGAGARRKSNITDVTKSKPPDVTVTGSESGSVPKPHENKGFFKKIKEKLSGHDNDP